MYTKKFCKSTGTTFASELKSLVQEGVNCHVVLFWENAFIVCNDETSILQHIYDAIMHFLYWCLRFDVLYTEMVKLH